MGLRGNRDIQQSLHNISYQTLDIRLNFPSSDHLQSYPQFV